MPQTDPNPSFMYTSVYIDMSISAAEDGWGYSLDVITTNYDLQKYSSWKSAFTKAVHQNAVSINAQH